MGATGKVLPVKLIVGLIFKEEPAASAAESILQRHFAGIDFLSDTLDFTHTGYYEKEFGANLRRRFLSFKKLIAPQQICRIKLVTNKIEQRLSREGSRLVNIDPGYLDLNKLVLATTKDYSHRIYAGRGIFVEVTLFYQGKAFKPWPWTYPDYATGAYIEIFNQIRQLYAKQIKKI